MIEPTGTTRLAEVDAHSIVPIVDEIGGVVIYLGGTLVYYVFNGEWFEALPELGAGVRPEKPSWQNLVRILADSAPSFQPQ